MSGEVPLTILAAASRPLLEATSTVSKIVTFCSWSDRWAFEDADQVRLSTAGAEPVVVHITTPVGLVATKSHAVGYPSVARRAGKHGSDLLDLFRLVDLSDSDGSLARRLRSGPARLAPIIADVAEREIAANPAAAANKMASASPTPIDPERVVATIEVFIDELRR